MNRQKNPQQNFTKLNLVIYKKDDTSQLSGDYSRIARFFQHSKISECNLLYMFSNHHRVKLKINNYKMSRKASNIFKLNTTILNNPWVKEEITGEIRKCFKLNDKFENETYQILYKRVKTMLRRKNQSFVSILESKKGLKLITYISILNY